MVVMVKKYTSNDDGRGWRRRRRTSWRKQRQRERSCVLYASDVKKMELRGKDDEDDVDVEMRRGEERDAKAIREMLLREKMSPLDVDPERFLVAVDEQDTLIGCAQLRPLGDPPCRVLELASVVVANDMRRRGLGNALVAELLRRHDSQGDDAAMLERNNSSSSSSSSQAVDVLLLTLRRTCSFYEQLGFERVSPTLDKDQFPIAFLAEFAVGTILARIIAGDALIIMRQRRHQL